MFNIDSEPLIRAKVEVKVPDQPPQDFRATFRVLDIDTYKSFDLDDADAAKGFLTAAIVDLADVVGVDEKPVPYSEALRERLINMPMVRAALARAYHKEVGEACLGN